MLNLAVSVSHMGGFSCQEAIRHPMPLEHFHCSMAQCRVCVTSVSKLMLGGSITPFAARGIAPQGWRHFCSFLAGCWPQTSRELEDYKTCVSTLHFVGFFVWVHSEGLINRSKVLRSKENSMKILWDAQTRVCKCVSLRSYHCGSPVSLHIWSKWLYHYLLQNYVTCLL